MSMERSFDIIDSGLVTVIFSQNSPVSSENLNLETVVINNPIEEGLCSSQDNNLCTVNVEETLFDHFKYPLASENQDIVIKVEEQPRRNSRCDEDLEKYRDLNPPEEAEHTHSPYLPSNGVPLLSSVVMQNKNPSVPSSSIFSPEGTASQNVREIPVFRSFIPPVAESARDICGLPQTSASVYDEIHEIRDAFSNVTENQQDRAIFQRSNVDDSGCKLLGLHSVMEESRCSHRNDCSPLVICQLEAGTQTLCINSCGTQELKPGHLILEYHNQHNYLQSDVDYPVTAVLGQISPLPSELVLNEQKACLDRNPAAFLPKIEKRELKEIKPYHNKGCNCKRSECLKNYCECFEVRQAKIMCSSICKCIGCKNYEETLDERTQSNVLNYMDFRNNEENSPVLTSTFEMLPRSKKDRQPAVYISWEEVKAVCACLLVQAQEAEERGYSVRLAEQMIMEEFGRCLSQILHA
ncbi:tesmin isoform X2 [Lathamus discolor]|uniref:tesmin isoform X2 n=1 Tax=Lathamus discolor TaxID=678569 RepID=UPI0032B7EC2E